jgi:NAD(P)-dependent dehydrogenase (short-subunit alcohol dehydrogenase family)
VVVTGAGTGFGAEIAVRAAQEGARAVGVHYRSSTEGAKRTADRVAAAGSTPVLLQADIVDWEQIKAMADAAFERLDGVDVLVNNVGDVAREQMSWRDITEESIDHVLAVDIKGTMLCVHEFGARMLEAGHGSIVNIGSTVIVRGSARAPQYAAAKYGIMGVTKSTRTRSRRRSGSTFSPRGSSRPRPPWAARTGSPAGATSCAHSPRWAGSRGRPSSRARRCSLRPTTPRT